VLTHSYYFTVQHSLCVIISTYYVTTFILLQCIDTLFVDSYKHTICVITFILCQCTDTDFVESYKHAIHVTTLILLQCIDTLFVDSYKYAICVITFILCQWTDTVFVESYKHAIHVTTFILLQYTQCLSNHTNILCYHIHTTSLYRHSLCIIIQAYCVTTLILLQCTDTGFVWSYKHTIYVITFIILKYRQCLYNHIFCLCHHMHMTSVYRCCVCVNDSDVLSALSCSYYSVVYTLNWKS